MKNPFEGAMSPAAVVDLFASKGIAISERTLRERARAIGAYRQIGRTMFFMPEDLEALMQRKDRRQAPRVKPVRRRAPGDDYAMARAALEARKRR